MELKTAIRTLKGYEMLKTTVGQCPEVAQPHHCCLAERTRNCACVVRNFWRRMCAVKLGCSVCLQSSGEIVGQAFKNWPNGAIAGDLMVERQIYEFEGVVLVAQEMRAI